MHMKSTILIPILLVLGAALATAGETPCEDGQLLLVLEQALFQPKSRGDATAGKPLTISLDITKGAWGERWGEAQGYNRATYPVQVTAASATPNGIHLDITVDVEGDRWVPGGPATYSIDLVRSPATGVVRSPHAALRSSVARAVFTGTHQGTFTPPGEPIPVKGAVSGILLPAAEPVAGFTPVPPGVHPRLLFRAEDLPRLRERLATPLGKAIAARLGATEDAIGRAFLYQVTGDAAHAAAARRGVEKIMADNSAGIFAKGRIWGYRVADVGLAYDLCLAGWDDAFRTVVEEYIDTITDRCLFMQHKLGSVNQAPGSNYVVVLNPGAGIGAFSRWRPGQEPPTPLTAAQAGDDLAAKLQGRFQKPGANPAATGPSPEQAQWQRAHDLWKATGGIDVRTARAAQVAARKSRLDALMGAGEGGFQGEGEGYTQECYHVIHDYAIIHRNATGLPLSVRPDISHFAARYVMTTDWLPGQSGAGWKAMCQGFVYGGTVGGKYLSRGIALCPPAWRPALLWHWLKHTGQTMDDLKTQAGAERFIKPLEDGLELVQTLLNLPLDLVPQEPGTVMPRFWEGATRGHCVMRDSWREGQCVILQAYAKQGPECGWNAADAGAFQLYGLGREWFPDGHLGRAANRFGQNVVLMPDDELNVNGNGRIIHSQGDVTTGSGSVTFDLNACYLGVTTEDGGKKSVVKKTVAGVAILEDVAVPDRRVTRDIGIAGLRALAADYRAGAPSVLAIVDRVTGGGRKVWQSFLPAGVNAQIDGQDFTIRQGDAVLHGRFIGDGPVTLKQDDGAQVVAGDRGQAKDLHRHCLIAESGEGGKNGTFFLVMTLGRGDIPPIAVEGQGLTATATVAGRRVRFADDKLIIAPAP